MNVYLYHYEKNMFCNSACNSVLGTKRNDRWVNYSHRLAQMKQQVGQCIVVTFLVHGQAINIHKLTRLTTPQI
jgi:hypothetical protein